MLSFDLFTNARQILAPVLNKTPLVYSRHFTQLTGNQVFFKPENLQLTGAYKVRGAFVKIARLPAEQKKKGLITASAGNHAQGVALAAQLQKLKATVVMPTTTPLVKVNNTKAYGATVILFGENYDEAYEHALELAHDKGMTFVHPFNDLDVASGQGTLAFEIIADLPDVDIIILPIGGGGLAAGVATLAKMLKPGIKIIGVEPVGAASMKLSVERGEVTSLDKVETIADGVAVKTPGDLVFPYVRENVDQIIAIEDFELIDAFLTVMETHKLIVENAGLLSVAALNHLGVKGKRVVSLLSGGNMDVITMASLVQHGLINRGRVFTFSVLLPDRPGELERIAHILAKQKGNIIRLEHNQFVSINRNMAVELKVTLEAFGHEHKDQIMHALIEKGYVAKVVDSTAVYD
ncbi:MAG: threonine ammonia-lyase [Eubacteriales bacterium]|nr:threonine ammonia-lyase [Eubacteriales bacterium]